MGGSLETEAGARSRWCRQCWGHDEESGFHSELASHRLGRWCPRVPSLTSQTTVATCVTLGRPSPPVQVLGDVVVFIREWQAGTQDTALSRPALNSWVCDKRQVLCLNLAAQTFHRSTHYPPRNETRAQGTCVASQLLLNKPRVLRKGS